MKYIFPIFISLIVSVASYCFGYYAGFDNGLSNGYAQGQVELALEIRTELGNTVNKSSIDSGYSHFKDIHDITIYVKENGDTKTLAFWDDETNGK